jgi:hypothetical protein
MALPSFACAVCNTGNEETLQHPFFQCPLALACWNLLLVQPANSNSIFDIMESLKTQLNTSIFMSIVILLCWTIWTTRNDLIFQEFNLQLLNVEPRLEKNSFCLCIE